jgi:hypothetical protein
MRIIEVPFAPSPANAAPAAAPPSDGSLPAPRSGNPSTHGELDQAGKKERGARQPHKRLLYYFNVNRTSLDHLLLGKCADVDKSVECPEYIAGSQTCQRHRFPTSVSAKAIPDHE